MKIDASTITGSAIIVMVNGRTYTFDRHGKEAKTAIEAIKANDGDKILKMKVFTLPTEISDSEVEVVDDELFFMGKPMHSVLADRIVELTGEGLDTKSYRRFLSNLKRNPNPDSVEQLYGFIEACGLSITDDGCFLAYKKVREDYRDKFSGTFLNTPGSVVRMDRSEVSTDPADACAPGLHVGAWGYSGHNGWFGGDKVMLVKVNPRNVCRVPNDHGCQKCAVCEYEVLREVPVDEQPEVLPHVKQEDEVPQEQWSEWGILHDGSNITDDGLDWLEDWEVAGRLLRVRIVYEKTDGTVKVYDGNNPTLDFTNEGNAIISMITNEGVRTFRVDRIKQALVSERLS